MAFEVAYPRIVKERRPEGHTPRAPRYRLTWDQPTGGFACAYFGVQGKPLGQADESDFLQAITELLGQVNGPQATEVMRCLDGAGYQNTMVVAYWSTITGFATWQETSGFRSWFDRSGSDGGGLGLWFEPFVSHFDRHETIYSEPHYNVGLANLPGTSIRSMTINGYFGAARDRVVLSAIDPLENLLEVAEPRVTLSHGSMAHVRVALPHNTTLLRSGQFWEDAGPEQRDDYIETMKPKLERGMDHLAQNPTDTGCLSLRMTVNLDDDGQERAETSTVAVFHSLDHLEKWAASHKTHLDIYNHAIKMNRHYGADREVVTWHELFVLQYGAVFEYINCHSQTGMMSYGRDISV